MWIKRTYGRCHGGGEREICFPRPAHIQITTSIKSCGFFFCCLSLKKYNECIKKKKNSFSSSLNTRGLSKQPTCIPILPALSVPSDLFFSILDNVSSDLFFGMERVIASCFLDRCDVLWD